MDRQMEQWTVFKFFVCLKKAIPYIVAHLMEAYKDKTLKPSTAKNGTNYVLDDEVVNAVHTFFDSLERADSWKTIIVKWV